MITMSASLCSFSPLSVAGQCIRRGILVNSSGVCSGGDTPVPTLSPCPAGALGIDQPLQGRIADPELFGGLTT